MTLERVLPALHLSSRRMSRESSLPRLKGPRRQEGLADGMGGDQRQAVLISASLRKKRGSQLFVLYHEYDQGKKGRSGVAVHE